MNSSEAVVIPPVHRRRLGAFLAEPELWKPMETSYSHRLRAQHAYSHNWCPIVILLYCLLLKLMQLQHGWNAVVPSVRVRGSTQVTRCLFRTPLLHRHVLLGLKRRT